MKEKRFNPFEESSEQIPTPEEILEILERVINREFIEVGRYEDERGIYRLDVQTPGDEEGEMVEYIYTRMGRYPQSQSTNTEISIAYYKDGIPFFGTIVARYIGGSWKIL
ncbi:MAG: hypothetical protein WC465_00440 [Patescibacteria group bacterium]